MNKTINNKITSFDAAECGAFGDVLSKNSDTMKLKVGLLGLGYFEYWRMYPKLQEIVRKDLDGVHERLKNALPGIALIYPGMVDTLDRAEAAGSELAAAGVEVVNADAA